MATPAATLIQRTRRFLGDWPESDSTGASITSSGTSLQIPDSTVFAPYTWIQVDTEIMQVRARPDATHLTVFRAARGSTGVSHASGATILNSPRFFDTDYLDALNSGVNAAFPLIFAPKIDESITTTDATYEYNIPNGADGNPMRAIASLEYKEAADLAFRSFSAWDVRRGATTPFLKLRRPLPGNGTLRVIGFGPVPPMASLAANLDSSFPTQAEDYLTLYAAQYLTAAGEAWRVRQDTGPNDDREAANRPGSSISLSNQLFTRARQRLMDSALPPMPKHAVFPL